MVRFRNRLALPQPGPLRYRFLVDALLSDGKSSDAGNGSCKRCGQAPAAETAQDSIIPLAAVPVSLVGTFAVMHALGFSINALSLSGTRPNGQRWVMFSFFGGGLGGSPESDGLNHGNAPISTATMRLTRSGKRAANS